MKLTLFIAVVSFGHLRELLAKSLLVPSAAVVVSPEEFVNVKNVKLLSLDDERRMIEYAIAYFNKREDLMNLQIRKLDLNKIPSAVDTAPSASNKDEVEQSLVLVKTKTTRQRGKRFIPQRSHLTPCLLKICNMGRKRQTHYL